MQDTSDADCVSNAFGPFEFCEVPDPMPGTWHLLVDHCFGESADFQAIATMLPANDEPPDLEEQQLIVSTFRGHELLQVDSSGSRATRSCRFRGDGPSLFGPEGIEFDSGGRVLVANAFGGNVLSVDPESGDRSVLSGCADDACTSQVGAGPEFMIPRFVKREPSGDVLVADRLEEGVYAIVRVDRTTRSRTLLSGCIDVYCSAVVGAGPPIDRLFGIELVSEDEILVADTQAVVRIDLTSGDREILSGCTDATCSTIIGSGPIAGEPADIAIRDDGSIFVTYYLEDEVFGAVRSIDAATGDRTQVSGCEDATCSGVRGEGPAFVHPLGLTPFGTDELMVADPDLDAVFVVDIATGDRSVYSGCVAPGCAAERGDGIEFAEPLDVLVVPEPGHCLLQGASAFAVAMIARLRRGNPSRGASRHS